MKKIILSLGLFLLLFAGLTVDASAKDMSRRFGLGVDSTISNYAGDGRGLSFIYVINKYFGMQIIFGMNTTNVEVEQPSTDSGFNNKFDTTVIEWNVAFRALIPIILTSEANLTGVVGFSASGVSSDGFKADYKYPEYMKYNDGYQFAIDLGVRPEWFVTEHISLHTQLGIGMNIITHDSSYPSAGLSKSDGQAYYSKDAKGVSVDFFKNVDLLGMAGMTFWF